MILLWSSERWTLRDKLVGSLLWPGGLVGPVVWLLSTVAPKPWICTASLDMCGDNGSAFCGPPPPGCGGTPLTESLLLVLALVVPLLTAAYLAVRLRQRSGSGGGSGAS